MVLILFFLTSFDLRIAACHDRREFCWAIAALPEYRMLLYCMLVSKYTHTPEEEKNQQWHNRLDR